MFVVIFRAKTRDLDPEYSALAPKLRDLALSQFHCLEFVSACEGDQEIALSYWNSEADIKAWKAHAEHLVAQQLGRERWYESYHVQIAEIRREYRSPR